MGFEAKMFDSNRDKIGLAMLGDGGFAPSDAELAMAPRIDNWSIRAGGMYDGCMIGTVTGHPVLPDGPVTTTRPQAANWPRGWVRTRNTLYRLGRHAGDDHE
jgi:hypothetical protein